MPNFKQFIKGFEEPEAQPEVKPQPKPEPKPQEVKPQPKKETPRGFVVGKDGFFEPKEYSEEEQNNAYFGAARFFSKSGKGPEEFLKEHPDYNADSVYAAYNDYKAGNEWKERKKEKEETLEQPKPAPKPGSFDKMIEGFDEPEQKQFSKEEIALADKAAEVLSHYAWGQGFKVEKLPNGNYLTNIHLDDPDAEPQEVGPDFILQEREKLLKSGDERFAELWEEYNK